MAADVVLAGNVQILLIQLVQLPVCDGGALQCPASASGLSRSSPEACKPAAVLAAEHAAVLPTALRVLSHADHSFVGQPGLA